jgi:hypothetical protein
MVRGSPQVNSLSIFQRLRCRSAAINPSMSGNGVTVAFFGGSEVGFMQNSVF